MKALVIYDSFFSNTEKVAAAIVDELSTKIESKLVNVKDFKKDMLTDIQLLIVGSPTRAFSPSPEISMFLKALPKDSLTDISIATFDTRISISQLPPAFSTKILKIMVGLFGYAAEPIKKGLVKKGGTPISDSKGFIVDDKEGPLKAGEIDRAKQWANEIVSLIR